MAFTTYGSAERTATFGRLALLRNELVTRFAKWRTYRKTVSELSELSERELDDLGLAPGDIRNVAMQAAYGA
ncbi:DUF1127 domain-containing protein [Jannaschia aquimarina]|uniref:YjiS-like domain-containing protein n=1 Tax=Jannaschia aquimarina TaxID=935700 RepID=A0A0D1EMD6_9RHOB|nr:DUF1127 domain-containing protein [Jannaschia aquimarina]KIT16835.1 hypothetical protein jaqu_13310 [Jannaschia aquimarina]SNT13294.1 protein of unknown function [Jannaschia aquimarina]